MVSPVILSRYGIEASTFKPAKIIGIDGTLHETHNVVTLKWSKDNVHIIEDEFHVAWATAPFDVILGRDYLLKSGVVTIDHRKMK